MVGFRRSSLSLQFTATSTYFRLSAGPVDIILTFISPVEVYPATSGPYLYSYPFFGCQPFDLVKQSTPFSYLTLQVISTDGDTHAVSVYTDISAEWVSASDNTRVVVWQSNTTGPVFTHQVMLETQQDYTEYKDFILGMFAILVSLRSMSILRRGSCLLFHNECQFTCLWIMEV